MDYLCCIFSTVAVIILGIYIVYKIGMQIISKFYPGLRIIQTLPLPPSQGLSFDWETEIWKHRYLYPL